MSSCYTPPPLSLNEILTARSSIFFNKFSFADGRGNYTPEALIGIMRGAKFDTWGVPMSSRDILILEKAMRDITAYLGFASVAEYADALEFEGNKIFFRVNNGNL